MWTIHQKNSESDGICVFITESKTKARVSRLSGEVHRQSKGHPEQSQHLEGADLEPQHLCNPNRHLLLQLSVEAVDILHFIAKG